MGYAMIGMLYSSSIGGRHEWERLTPADKERLRRVAEFKRKELALDKGLKEFSIDGFSIMALNEKNAIRKINALKLKIKNINDE